MEPHEEKIQPTIKETANKIPSMGESIASRKNSLAKSISQVSIISSLLNEEEKKFLGATKNQSNLYSTPLESPTKPAVPPKPAMAQSPSITMDSLSPDLKPLSINSISPEPETLPTKDASTHKNPLGEQEKNLQLPPKTMTPAPSNQQGFGGPEKQFRKKRLSTIVWLGAAQLVISIILVALGGLVIARGASLAGSCAGVWTGAIAGLTGAFGIMGEIKRARTAFLACSLICVASSTLALALTGIGAVRDSNLAAQDEVRFKM